MSSGLSYKQLYENYYDHDLGLSTYFGSDSDFKQDAFTERGEIFDRWFRSEVKGDILIKYGGALLLSSLLPACEYFNKIIIVDFVGASLKGINQWLDKEPGIIVPCELEKDREIWTEKEEKMRKVIKEVVKAELPESYPVAPGLRVQADCILSEFCLEFLSRDENAYCKALKSMSSLLNLGGCLVMFAFLKCTFYMVGTFKFPMLCLEAEFVKKAVIDSGFIIKECHITPRYNTNLYSTSDFSSKLFILAHKAKVVE
ncbi:nicotinamide N-methyltransferase-like isoform X2 [Lissotriton helveticus]